MRFILFFLVLFSESIFSAKVIANTNIERKTDEAACMLGQPRYCDDEQNNKIGEFIPIAAPKVEPRITTGMMQYRYGDGLVGKLKGNMPFIGGGLLTSYKKWVLDMYYQSSFINTDSNDQKVPFISKEFDTFQSRDIERDDYTVSLGYNMIDNLDYRIVDNLWLFLGYKKGTTAIDTTAILFGDNLGSRLNVDIRVKTHGPFIGTMIGKRIGDSQLGINMGLTWLMGKYNFKESNQIQGDSEESYVYGYRLGIDWNAPITNIHPRITLRYNLSLNAYQYRMNIEKTRFFENLEAKFPVKEEIYSFRAALLLQWW